MTGETKKLVARLRQARHNVSNARHYASVGFLAGWEHRALEQAADLIERLVDTSLTTKSVVVSETGFDDTQSPAPDDVERVARAIAADQHVEWPQDANRYRRYARAAITAMGQPS